MPGILYENLVNCYYQGHFLWKDSNGKLTDIGEKQLKPGRWTRSLDDWLHSPLINSAEVLMSTNPINDVNPKQPSIPSRPKGQVMDRSFFLWKDAIGTPLKFGLKQLEDSENLPSYRRWFPRSNRDGQQASLYPSWQDPLLFEDNNDIVDDSEVLDPNLLSYHEQMKLNDILKNKLVAALSYFSPKKTLSKFGLTGPDKPLFSGFHGSVPNGIDTFVQHQLKASSVKPWTNIRINNDLTYDNKVIGIPVKKPAVQLNVLDKLNVLRGESFSTISSKNNVPVRKYRNVAKISQTQNTQLKNSLTNVEIISDSKDMKGKVESDSHHFSTDTTDVFGHSAGLNDNLTSEKINVPQLNNLRTKDYVNPLNSDILNNEKKEHYAKVINEEGSAEINTSKTKVRNLSLKKENVQEMQKSLSKLTKEPSFQFELFNRKSR